MKNTNKTRRQSSWTCINLMKHTTERHCVTAVKQGSQEENGLVQEEMAKIFINSKNAVTVLEHWMSLERHRGSSVHGNICCRR